MFGARRKPAPRAGTVADAADQLERMTLRARGDIVALFRKVEARHAPVIIELGQGRFVATVLLAVDPSRGEVVFDYGADAEAMARLLATPKLALSTALDQVRIEWKGGSATPVVHGNAPAFRLPLPERVVRWQRRDAYRLRLPLSKAIVCEVGAPGTELPRRHAARVRDLSVAGLGLAELPRHWLLAPGMRFARCRFALDGRDAFVVDLEVVHVPGGEPGRCGCRFVDLPHGQAAAIQRYITALDLARASLGHGRQS